MKFQMKRLKFKILSSLVLMTLSRICNYFTKSSLTLIPKHHFIFVTFYYTIKPHKNIRVRKAFVSEVQTGLNHISFLDKTFPRFPYQLTLLEIP
jgi:hypothetical protein